MADEGKVRVRIRATQRVRYDQTVTMTRAEWDELKATDENEIEDDGGPLSGWLEMSDVASADDFDDAELFVVDDKGKPVQPADEYTGEA